MSQELKELLERAQRLTPDEQKQLVAALTRPAPAKENGDPPRTLYDAWMARGLIGSIRDAPPDLATNPKYMEGFGGHAD